MQHAAVDDEGDDGAKDGEDDADDGDLDRRHLEGPGAVAAEAVLGGGGGGVAERVGAVGVAHFWGVIALLEGGITVG